MNEGQYLRVRVGVECFIHHIRINRCAPLEFHRYRFSATAYGVFHHAPAKNAVDGDHHLVTRLQQVHERAFHAGRARRGNRQRHEIFSLECLAQRFIQPVHEFDKGRVQVADRRLRHGSKHLGIDIGGPGAHQYSFR